MKERHKVVPAVYLLLENIRGEVLLALRQNTGYQDGNWNLPSGHVEPGELPFEALIRESEEELGIKLYQLLDETAPEPLVHTMFRQKSDETGDRIDLFYRATNWDGIPRNTEPHKCAEIRYFSYHALPTNLVPHVREALERIRLGSPYSELSTGWHRNS